MYFTKILDYPTIQGYLIHNIDKSLDKKYPYEFIFTFIDITNLEKKYIGNSDQIPDRFTMGKYAGYIFCKHKCDLTKIFVSTSRFIKGYRAAKMERNMKVFKYKTKIAIRFCNDTHNALPGLGSFSQDIYYNIDNEFFDVSREDFEKYIKDLYMNFGTNDINSPKKWFECVLMHPIGDDYNCIYNITRYPDTINDKTFTKKQLEKDFDIDRLAISYDFYVDTKEKELELARKMDELVVPKNEIIYIPYYLYTNLAERIKESAKRLNIPYKDSHNVVKITFGNILKLDVKYHLTDIFG